MSRSWPSLTVGTPRYNTLRSRLYHRSRKIPPFLVIPVRRPTVRHARSSSLQEFKRRGYTPSDERTVAESQSYRPYLAPRTRPTSGTHRKTSTHTIVTPSFTDLNVADTPRRDKSESLDYVSESIGTSQFCFVDYNTGGQSKTGGHLCSTKIFWSNI